MKTIPVIPHSPAPWRHLGACILDEHDLSVGNTYSLIRVQEGVQDPTNGGKVGQKANADLVVIAPAMYAALKAIFELTSDIAEPGSLAHQVLLLAYHAFDAVNPDEIHISESTVGIEASDA